MSFLPSIGSWISVGMAFMGSGAGGWGSILLPLIVSEGWIEGSLWVTELGVGTLGVMVPHRVVKLFSSQRLYDCYSHPHLYVSCFVWF